MKTKRTLTTATVLVALAALMTLGIFRGTRRVHAQDQQPPTQPDRISFGMVGITQGQTLRVTAVNTTLPNDANYPPGPSRVALTFLNSDGQLFRNRDGSVVRRVVMLERGHAAFLDFDFDEFPPGPVRLQLRAVVNVLAPPHPESNELPPATNDRIVPSVEVFDNANGRTVLFMGNPGVIRGFNPQPDPPLGQ